MRDRYFFVSDVHLGDHSPGITALFLEFLRGPAQRAGRLYILGDLFNAWVGNDLLPSFHEGIADALNTLSHTGVSIFFLPGNRDFLVTTDYLNALNITQLPERTVIDLHGVPTLLLHGDLLCTQDSAYQRYRQLAQHPWTRAAFLRLPRPLRQKIAMILRRKSGQYQKTLAPEILDVSPDAVTNTMIHTKVQQMIHGHVHRPAIHATRLGTANASRLVLGDWDDTTGSVIIADPGRLTLATYHGHHAFAVSDTLSTV